MGSQGRPGVPGGLILGIESSCDETAAAVVRAGGEVLANVVASQIALHSNYGGVVPELASREHLRNIVPVVRAAMAEAGLEFADLDAIAVTEGPGLAGALLVGITYAKALALGVGKPLIAVNHLEGHIHAVLMEARQRQQSMEMPMLALVVSGGHTHLYLAEFDENERRTTEILSEAQNDERRGSEPSSWRYRNVGRTVDDAAGEAYDKVAKLLGLGYPGGPWMDALAKAGNPRAVEFRFQQIKARRAVASTDEKQIPPLRCGMTNKKTVDGQHFDFSFSGIKTAVLRYIQTNGMQERVEARRRALTEALKANPAMRPVDALREMPEVFDRQTLDLIASFQYAVVGNLMRQTFAAAETFGVRGIVVSGGVSANSELRRRFAEEAARRGLPVAFPTMAMSTDNAAMIAAAAWGKFCAGEFAKEGLVATPQLRLG
ncbi:MAG: tRNA (adenosine(37)-N6)-threonylcarbamoyltransferase complex transferase subunit TsaD [Acidobacteriaceae bacterium]|jgi:N6-L-threonylcarbamoyladenine synthase